MECPFAQKKSCDSGLIETALNGIDRAFITSSGVKRVFKPASDECAQELFKKKNITDTCKFEALALDAHLLNVAQNAGLNGLAIFSSENLGERYPMPAITGKSVSEFRPNGKICHAIAVPAWVCRNEDAQVRLSILRGVVEREIVRIQQAYTSNDEELIATKQLALKAGYVIGALVVAYCLPSTLLGSAPLGLLGFSQDEYLYTHQEAALDEKVVSLTGNHDNVLATMVHVTSDKTAQQNALQEAQDALEGFESTWYLTERPLRIYYLLKAHEAWLHKAK